MPAKDFNCDFIGSFFFLFELGVLLESEYEKSYK